MFRKIVILLFVLSPLWFTILIGYPIISQKVLLEKQRDRPGITLSKRCFAVGDFREFRNCFSISEKIKGTDFFSEVYTKTNYVSPAFTALFMLSLIAFVAISISFIL